MDKRTLDFQNLTPESYVNLHAYDEALNYVFSCEKVKNIAISGAYGAGKSSILESYKNRNKEVNFLHISLAHFESPATETQMAENVKKNDSVLEGKIINQLIHQIEPEDIPQTNFTVKCKMSKTKMAAASVFITILLFTVLYTINFNQWSQFVSSLTPVGISNILSWTLYTECRILSGILGLLMFGFAIYKVIDFQNRKGILKKLNIKGNEIEVFEECKDSYFDKYLNEVLYLFDRCKADVIVFEDIDRFDTTLIFERLREMNTLINNKKKRHDEKPLRFFYLLRDEIFQSKDRTKFFDFIIPVVPVIDGSNSFEKFLDIFQQGRIIELFNTHFLKDISLYVDDMRILKNIYNEFAIYYNRIQSTELDNNKLLAMIIFKNIFPREFNNLQLGMGFVYTLFAGKENYIQSEKNRIDNEIGENEVCLQNIDKELLKSSDELDAVYLTTQSTQRISCKGKFEINYATRAEFVRSLKENPNDVYTHDIYNNKSRYDIMRDFSKFVNNSDYLERKMLIENKVTEERENRKLKIHSLQEQKAMLANCRLKDIINKSNIDTIFNVSLSKTSFREVESSHYFPLIKYLIRNGFIDETYSEYMTYFYENSLSVTDKIFLRSITDQQAKEFTYKLKNPENVISRLQGIDFDHEEILNFDLLTYLLQSPNVSGEYSAYLSRFFEQIKNIKHYEFISCYIDSRKDLPLFINYLNHFWPSIFYCILHQSNMSNEQKKSYAIFSLYYSSDEDILALNTANCLGNFISSHAEILDIDKPNIEKIINGFSLLNVQLESFNYEVSSKPLLDAIYSNYLYKLSFENIGLFLNKIYQIPKSDDFFHKNYTLVFSMENEPLAKYVNRNINNYVDIVNQNCKEYINDDESNVIKILNNSSVSIKNKVAYIKLLKTMLNYLEDVKEKELWGLLIKMKIVRYSEGNVLNYFFNGGNGMDSILIEFINRKNHLLEIDPEKIASTWGQGAVNRLFDATVASNDLLNEEYHSILKSLSLRPETFNIAGIESDKIDILVDQNIIKMSEDNLKFIRENYPQNLASFIEHNITLYVNDIIDETNFDHAELLSVLEMKINVNHKLKLLKLETGSICTKVKGYTDAVKEQILLNNLDKNDIPYLLESYLNERERIQAAIEKIAIIHISTIISKKYTMPINLFSKLLASDQLSQEQKKEIFILVLPNMEKENCLMYLEKLNLSAFLPIFEGKHPRLNVTSINERILKEFKNRHWSNYDYDKENKNYFRAYGRRA